MKQLEGAGGLQGVFVGGSVVWGFCSLLVPSECLQGDSGSFCGLSWFLLRDSRGVLVLSETQGGVLVLSDRLKGRSESFCGVLVPSVSLLGCSECLQRDSGSFCGSS